MFGRCGHLQGDSVYRNMDALHLVRAWDTYGVAQIFIRCSGRIIYGLSLASPLAWIAVYSNLLGWVGLNFTEIYGSGAATFGSAVPWMVIILVPQVKKKLSFLVCLL